MNKLLMPPSGGLKFRPELIEFEQASYRAAIEALLRPVAAFNSGNMILWGLDVSTVSGTTTITEGYVLLNYELRYFPETSLSSFAVFSIVPDDTLDAIGLDNLANGTSFNSTQKRTAKTEASLSGMPVVDQFRYYNLLKIGLDSLQDFDEVILTPRNSWVQSSAPTRLRVNKKGKTATIWGELVVGDLSGTSYTLVTTLPVGYRPFRRQYHIVPFINTGAGIMDINTNGEVNIINLVGTVVDNQSNLLHVPEITYELQ